jgi:hypothetical protein
MIQTLKILCDEVLVGYGCSLEIDDITLKELKDDKRRLHNYHGVEIKIRYGKEAGYFTNFRDDDIFDRLTFSDATETFYITSYVVKKVD